MTTRNIKRYQTSGSSNQGLWIGLGSAALVLVAFLVWSSNSSPKRNSDVLLGQRPTPPPIHATPVAVVPEPAAEPSKKPDLAEARRALLANLEPGTVWLQQPKSPAKADECLALEVLQTERGGDEVLVALYPTSAPLDLVTYAGAIELVEADSNGDRSKAYMTLRLQSVSSPQFPTNHTLQMATWNRIELKPEGDAPWVLKHDGELMASFATKSVQTPQEPEQRLGLWESKLAGGVSYRLQSPDDPNQSLVLSISAESGTRSAREVTILREDDPFSEVTWSGELNAGYAQVYGWRSWRSHARSEDDEAANWGFGFGVGKDLQIYVDSGGVIHVRLDGHVFDCELTSFSLPTFADENFVRALQPGSIWKGKVLKEGVEPIELHLLMAELDRQVSRISFVVSELGQPWQPALWQGNFDPKRPQEWSIHAERGEFALASVQPSCAVLSIDPCSTVWRLREPELLLGVVPEKGERIEFRRVGEMPRERADKPPDVAACIRSCFARGAHWTGTIQAGSGAGHPIEVFVERGPAEDEPLRLRIASQSEPLARCIFEGRLRKDVGELCEWAFVGTRTERSSTQLEDPSLFASQDLPNLFLRWAAHETLVGIYGDARIELELEGQHAAAQDALLRRLAAIDQGWITTSKSEVLEQCMRECKIIEKEAAAQRWTDIEAKAKLERCSIVFERLGDSYKQPNNLGGVKRHHRDLELELLPLLELTDTQTIEGGSSVQAEALRYVMRGTMMNSVAHDLLNKFEHPALYKKAREYLVQLGQRFPHAIDHQGRNVAAESNTEFERLRIEMEKH